MKCVCDKHLGIWFLFWLTFLLAFGEAAGQGPDRRLAKVFGDWKKRQGDYQSVRYVAVGERVTTPNQLVDTDPKGRPIRQAEKTYKDILCPRRFSFLADFVKGRHRTEMRQEIYDYNRRSFYPRVTVEMFDGKALKTAIPRAQNLSEFHSPAPSQPEIVEQTGGFSNFTPDYWPILVGHGIIPTVHRQIVPGMLIVKPEEELFYVHGQGVFSGRNCLVVRTVPARQAGGASYNEYWVDEARESAVVRFVSFYGARSAIDIGIDYQETDQGYFPLQWTWMFSDPDGKTLHIDHMRVEEFEANPPFPENDPSFDVKPGMVVQKTKIEEPSGQKPMVDRINEKTYMVGDNGKLVDVNGGRVVSAWSFSYCLILPLLTLLGVASWLWFRHRPRYREGG